MYYLIILGLIIFDQISKFIVKRFMDIGESIGIIPGMLNITYIQNRGAAFGMLQGRQLIFVFIGVVVVGYGLYFISRRDVSRIEKYSISLILSGAVGNIIDRLKDGFVTDFFDFKFIWDYIFNIADIYIVVGVIIYILNVVYKEMSLKKNMGNKN